MMIKHGWLLVVIGFMVSASSYGVDCDIPCRQLEMQRAVEEGDTDFIEENLDWVDEIGWSWLHCVAFVGKYVLLKDFLLEESRMQHLVDLSSENFLLTDEREIAQESTPLHIAAMCGDIFCLSLLCSSIKGPSWLRSKDARGKVPKEVAYDESTRSLLEIFERSLQKKDDANTLVDIA